MISTYVNTQKTLTGEEKNPIDYFLGLNFVGTKNYAYKNLNDISKILI